MIGLGSIEMAAVYWLCLISSAGCIIYGILNWNNKGKPDVTKLEVEVKKSEDGSK